MVNKVKDWTINNFILFQSSPIMSKKQNPVEIFASESCGDFCTRL